MTNLTILCPSMGRATLRDTLQSVKPQLLPGDEFWLASDGPPSDLLLRIWAEAQVPGRYMELPGPHNDWGHTPRNLMLKEAGGRPGYILYIDDDDICTPWALASIRKAIQEVPDGIFLFKMAYRDGRLLWAEKNTNYGNVSTQQIVHPAQEPLGVWHSPYGADTEFIRETIAANPERPLVWREEIIAQISVLFGTPLCGAALTLWQSQQFVDGNNESLLPAKDLQA